MKVIVIGNGIAGVITAAKLRELEKDAAKLEIHIYSREPYPYYSRIRLPEIFGLNKTIKDLQIYKEDWYDKKAINVHYNFTAQEIIPAQKRILFSDGSQAIYDKLILACGAESIIPGIKNNKLPGIFKIREYEDALAIKRHIDAGARQAVVLGGGLLGLEAARYLKKIKDITIVEIFPRLLPRQLDEQGALILKGIIENMGLKIMLSAEVVEFLGEKRLEGIRLKDGKILKADTTLVSIGIRPRIELAEQAGLKVNRGVVVNEFLESSVPDVYVAGDMVEFQNIVWGLIPAALDHAPIVAHNVLYGNQLKYRQTIPKTSLKVVGVDLTSTGKVILTPEENNEYTVVVKTDKITTYEKYVLKDGLLKGAIILGNKNRTAWVEKNMEKKVNKEELENQQ
jgi:nitrite reductase (NADH) large subunit